MLLIHLAADIIVEFSAVRLALFYVVGAHDHPMEMKCVQVCMLDGASATKITNFAESHVIHVKKKKRKKNKSILRTSC